MAVTLREGIGRAGPIDVDSEEVWQEDASGSSEGSSASREGNSRSWIRPITWSRDWMMCCAHDEMLTARVPTPRSTSVAADGSAAE